ncbi:MAG TPA: aminotransferase class V-fold PLP-dependent enzyme [Myxococcota bacterium]|nr:aminotransferase class V-fold PLP-dependent enzyme [Myxococcota bacterium]
MRATLPRHGSAWPALEARMREYAAGDVDWRSGRAAVYVFHAGEDVLRVAADAYALFQSENALGPLAFPSLRRMEQEVVEIGLSLLHAPDGACGNMTSGGTESIFLAVKACRDGARARGSRADLLVLPRSAHPAFDKAASYLGLRCVRVPVAADFCADPEAMARASGDDALMLVGSAPCFPYGVIDPIEELAAISRERGVWLHVDACVGGYLAPFARMNGVALPAFDFEVPGVRSISADLHKYGYAAKGASTLFHRDEAQRAHQIFEFHDWPAGGMTTPTAAGTRPGGAIAAAWAVLHYLGESGYREKARQVCDTRERIARGVAAQGLRVLGDPRLGIVAYTADDLDVFAVWGRLARRGWMTALCTEPKAIHLMLSPAHAQVADVYLADLAQALAEVRAGASGADVRARYA